MEKSISIGLLHSLPAELVCNVLKYLSKGDLCNLRTTCKAMSCYTTPYAFEKLHVWFEEQSLQSLNNIASDPILCKNVKNLEIGMDYFYNIDFEEFKKYIYYDSDTLDLGPLLKKSEHAQRRDAWRVYRRYYRKQQALEQSGRDLAMMTEALISFSSLVSVKLMDYQPWVDGFKGPRLLRTEKLLRKHMLTVPDPRIWVPRGGQQIRILLQALAASDRKIEELILYLNSYNITHTGCYGPLPEEFLSISVQALKGLERLALVLDPIKSQLQLLPASEKDPLELSLTTILRAATQLKCLSVELAENCDQPWKNYIQIPRIGQLRELFVTETLFHEADFALFLRSSCQGLHKFTLGEAKVEEESWDLIFEAIRSLPKLETIELYSLWHEIPRVGGMRFLENIDAQPLYDYLLRRREDNPWDSMCQAEWDQYMKEHPSSDESESEATDQDME